MAYCNVFAIVFSIQEPNALCSYGLCGNFTEECKDKKSQTKGSGVPINTKPEVEKLANRGMGRSMSPLYNLTDNKRFFSF